MGQKTHPYGFRLGVIRTWASKWYEDKNYAKWLHEDLKLRKRDQEEVRPRRHRRHRDRARGQQGQGRSSTPRVPASSSASAARASSSSSGELQKLTENELFIDVQEVRKAETNAQLVAENIATQLERRVAFRRAMKKALQTAMKFGAKGIRVRTLGPPRRRRDRRVRELPRRSRSAPHAARRHRVRRGRRPTPRTAPSASRSGSSRARSFRSAAARSARGARLAERWSVPMLSPKRTKFRKQQKGKNRGLAYARLDVAFGDFGLQALEPGRVTSRQIEAARMAIQRATQARGQALDPRLPRQARHQEAARDSYGSRQGRVGRVGRAW